MVKNLRLPENAQELEGRLNRTAMLLNAPCLRKA
ncbi:hypothetical protein [Rufibacter quisquiliarum]